MSGYDIANILNQNQLLTAEIRRRVDQLSAINSVAALVSQSLDLKTTLELALDSVLQIIPVEGAGISLVNEETQELVLRAQRGWKQDFVTNPMRIPLGEGLSGIVWETDKVVVTGDITDDPRVIVPAFVEEKVQAMALAPMHARGRIVGIVSVMSYKPYTFIEEQTQVLQAIADQLGVALDNARLYEDTRAKQSRLSALIDSTTDAIIAVDSKGVINLVNSSAETLFDVKADKLMGLLFRDTFLHPRLREEAIRIMNFPSQTETTFEIILESGRYLSVAISPVHYVEPLPNDDIDEGGWVMVIQDITHLRDSERNRVRFVRTAAHDLQNPLGVAQSSLSMLLSHIAEDSQDHEIVGLALGSIEQMQLLIDDLLSLEQVQSGAVLEMIQLDMRDLLERAMLEISPSIQHKQQKFILDVDDSLPPVLGDSRWLSRALVNLLSNANKYTPTSGEIWLIARHHPEDREIVIEVHDSGIGIAPTNRKRVFETFYREPKVKDEITGTGLGLSIVKTVAEQHGGRVYVKGRGREGKLKGTIFGVGLPVASQTEPE